MRRRIVAKTIQSSAIKNVRQRAAVLSSVARATQRTPQRLPALTPDCLSARAVRLRALGSYTNFSIATCALFAVIAPTEYVQSATCALNAFTESIARFVDHLSASPAIAVTGCLLAGGVFALNRGFRALQPLRGWSEWLHPGKNIMRAGIAWSLLDMVNAPQHAMTDPAFANAYGDLLLGSGFLYAIHALEQMNGKHDHEHPHDHATTNRAALILTNVLFALCALEDVAHIGLGVLRNS